jgi:hypothetical protein
MIWKAGLSRFIKLFMANGIVLNGLECPRESPKNPLLSKTFVTAV